MSRAATGAAGRFRELAEAVPVGVFRSDENGACSYVNSRLSEISGRPASAFLGEGWMDLVHPDDRDQARTRWDEAFARGAPYRDEVRLVRPDGGEVWVLAQALPERDAGGRVTGYLGSALDITALRRSREAMAALAASAALDLEAFVDDSARRLARAYGVRYASVGLLTGEAPARMRLLVLCDGGRCVRDITYDLAGTPCADVLAGRVTLIPDGVAEQYPEDLVLAQMGIRSYFGSPLVDADGRPVGVVNVMDVRPMTLVPSTESILGSFARRIAAEVERHRAEARLKAEERRLAQAQHIAGLGYWEYDPVADRGTMSEEGWHIVGLAPQAAALPEEAFLQCVHPDDREGVRARLQAAFDPARRTPYTAHYRVVRPGGEVRYVHDQAEVTFDPATGRVVDVLGTMQDVTDQHRAQEAMAALAASSAVDLDAFVRDCARHLARAYGARYAFVGRLTSDRPARMRTLAFWTGEGFAANVTYDLEGTPCAEVTSGKLLVVPDRVPERYPQDLVLARMGVESYYGSPLIGADGAPIGLVAVLDVRPMALRPWTESILGSFARRIAAELERHRAEAVRAASERELAAILEHLQDTYFRVEPAGRLVRVSPSCRALLGHEPAELVGRRLEALLADPADLGRLREALAAGGGRLSGYELALRHRQGHEVWVATNVQPARGPGAGPRGLEGTARDISGARLMARALRESEARLADTQAIAHLGSWEWNLDAGAQTWSDETYRIYGLRPDGHLVPHSRFLDAVHPEDRSALETALRATTEDDLPLRADHRIIRPDGTCRVVRQIGVLRRDPGMPERVVGAVQDITDLTRAEADRERFQGLLLQAQKMEAVGLLAGGVAHDFNNLLTTISGYTELALGRGLTPDDPVLKDLTEIRRAAERAAALTRQLLLFSRRQPMDFVLLDVSQRVGALLGMLGRIIGGGVSVRADLGRGLWPVRADGTSLDQVVMNLAINARDAMPRGGEITIATTNRVVTAADAGGHPEAAPGRCVRLSVADTGIGMDRATRARVFEPFFTTKDPGRGTGLGMSVAHGIVKQHDGWIEVQSRPGAGTTFHVYLPAAAGVLAAVEPEGNADADPAPPPGDGRSVLLVEDEDSLRAFVRTALEGHGYRVVAAATAGEARELFESAGGAFDLVFSDVVLPDGSGLNLVADLRARRPDLKVLLSSGYPDPHEGFAAVQASGLPFVQKPYALSAMLAEVARAARVRASRPA